MKASTLVSILLEEVDPKLLKAALNTAMRSENPEHVKMALDLGADVNAPVYNRFGLKSNTPIVNACIYGHNEVVRLLVQRPDVDVNARAYEDSWTPLYRAVKWQQVEQVRLLLSHPKIEVNKLVHGYTPMDAALQSTDEIRALLKRAGAKVSGQR